ncbi:hypothetical protein D6829_00165 [Candidatus Pacearchaeota archaeon]|nr:MAG: hypothetical protein D6829_00165 [Candidatus Pacearchaeota archaeon]
MVFGEFFSTIVLPFLLIFVLTFAILQRSKLLGENPRTDSLTALAIALLFVSVPTTRTIVIKIIPWIGVGAAALLLFFILYGFVSGEVFEANKGAPKWAKITFGILIGIFSITVIVLVSGLDQIISKTFSGTGKSVWENIFLIVVVVGVFFIAVFSGKKSSSTDD